MNHNIIEKLARREMLRTSAEDLRFVHNDSIYDYLFSLKNPSPKKLKKDLSTFLSSKDSFSCWTGLLLWSLFTKCTYPAVNKIGQALKGKARKAASSILKDTKWLSDWKNPEHVEAKLLEYQKGVPDTTLSKKVADDLVVEYIKPTWDSIGKKKGLTYLELQIKLSEGDKGPWLMFLYNPRTSAFVQFSGVLEGHPYSPKSWDEPGLSIPEQERREAEIEAYKDKMMSTIRVESGFRGQSVIEIGKSNFTQSTFYTKLEDLKSEGFIEA